MSKVLIRNGEKKDAPGIYSLIAELAAYEKASHKLVLSLEEFTADGFGKQPAYKTLVAELNHQIVGMMLYYPRYSTWRGKCIYLEDFAVREDARERGIGQLLFDKLRSICTTENVALLTWQVLDWNKPAIAFYEKNKATLEHEWVNCKLETRR